MNGLSESGRPYREFSDYKDMQDYLDKITGQEIVIESSIDPKTETEFDSRIVWETEVCYYLSINHLQARIYQRAPSI